MAPATTYLGYLYDRAGAAHRVAADSTVHKHLPVLLVETMQALSISKDGVYVDATFGRGGHCRAMLEALSDRGRVIALDRDPQAIAAAENLRIAETRLQVFQARFAELDSVIAGLGLNGAIQGVLMDVGVSSPQLDDPERGFSFRHAGPLDMRMDPSQGVDAAQWLNSADEEVIANVIWRYGESVAHDASLKPSLQPGPCIRLKLWLMWCLPVCRVAMPSQPNIRRPKLFKRCEFSSTMSCKNCSAVCKGLLTVWRLVAASRSLVFIR